jgi:hypothetical protein
MKKFKNFQGWVRLFVLSLIVLNYAACSQPCALTLEQAPELRGFRLGMNLEQIQRRFQGFPNPPANEFGLATVIIDPTVRNEVRSNTGYTFIDASRYPDFNGVDRIYLKIVDGHVAEIEVYYKNDLNWRSVDDFVARTSESLNLRGSWRTQNEDYKSLSCSGFSVYAGIKEDYLRMDRHEKLPYIKLVNFMRALEPMMREHNRNENANRREQERRDSFNP